MSQKKCELLLQVDFNGGKKMSYIQGVPKKVWITTCNSNKCELLLVAVIHTFFGTPCI